MCLGKRFLFGIISIICITIISIKLNFPPDAVVKLVGMICGLYVASQTITDYKNGGTQ